MGTAGKIAFVVIFALVALIFIVVVSAFFMAVIKGQGPAPKRQDIILRQGSGLLPLWLHFLCNILSSCILILLGFFLLGGYFVSFGLNYAIAYPAGAIFGGLMSRALYCELLSVRCPSCTGRAFRSWGSRIVYTCRDCGYRHDTGITSSSGDMND